MTRPIAIQLYSLREEAADDLDRTLSRLAQCGFLGVECADLHGCSPAEFRGRVADLGMEICSAHSMAVGDAAAAALDTVAQLGTSLAVVPFAAPDRFATADGVDGVAAQLNTALPIAQERGLSLAYHNHFWEWTVLSDGRLAFDRLLERLDPAIGIELDVYWAQTAGRNPVALLDQLGERASRLHLKDGPADDPGAAMTAAGTGAVDFAAVAAADQAAWHIIELDRCETDMFDAVEASYRYLTRAGLSRGRSNACADDTGTPL